MINGVTNIQITEDDIRYAENILFEKVNVFDKEERIPIIENFNESFDVNACPGSGKTTVLLAKLILLSRKMPLKNGQGVCVLTHTNVAIDEIKNKLGEKSDILFKYPNYFGTIQNFVDKYLAIPYFKRQTGEHIKSIDDDLYFDHLRKLSKIRCPNISNSIEYCIDKGWGSYTNESYEKNFVSYISNRYLHIHNNEIVIRDYNYKILSGSYYKDLRTIMFDKCLNKGILRYADAYILAKKYLIKFSRLQDYFSSRFRYIFIDEMQDVSSIQMDVLDKIFDAKKVIIQRFGDVNQSIGQFEPLCNNWKINKCCKIINSSKRYGEGIIKFLEPLRVVKKGNMIGNKNINTLNPHIIVFNDSTINKVIYKYFDILNKYNIKQYGNKKIKIIGKLGIQVENPYKSISSYVDGYNRTSDKQITLNKKVANKLKKIESTKEFYDYLITIILLALDKDGKKVVKDELIKLMEQEYMLEFIEYRSNIINWIKNIGEGTEKILEDIIVKTQELFSIVKEINCNNEILKSKLQIYSDEEVAKEEVAVGNEHDKYQISQRDNIDTIFGTKGETHLATLYLESKLVFSDGKDISDISRITDYMLNKKIEVEDNDKEALMNAYVAMSRAERLTCIAIQYDTIKGRIKDFKEYGYEVIGCDERIEKLIDIEK